MTKDKTARCIDPLDCIGCGTCVSGEYLHDDPIECMIEGEHLTDCDDDGYCNLCGHQESEVIVQASLDPDYGQDFCGTVIGFKDNRKLVSVLDQEENVWDVERQAIKLAD